MPGHDVQRRSRSAREIRPAVRPLWHVQFDALLPSRVQIVTALRGYGAPDTVYVTAADGIHALDPDTGAERWFYAMEMPPGNAPTVDEGMVIVGGTDRTVHAIRASDGGRIWQTAKAGAAFYVNPTVVGQRVFAGNRDGYFYCFDRSNGDLVWSRNVGSPITVSAAFSVFANQPEGAIFFASWDRCAYSLDAGVGDELWSTCGLPGGGFHAYWPVVTPGRVLFVTSSSNHPVSDVSDLNARARDQVLLGEGELRSLVDADGALDVKHHIDHLTRNPSQRSLVVLDAQTGEEREIAPVLWWGNPGGQRYPPAIDAYGTVWVTTSWIKSWFPRGGYAGWTIGTTRMRTLPHLLDGLESADEPEAYSIIGSHVYHNDGGDGADKGGIVDLVGTETGFWAIDLFYRAFGQYWGRWADRKYGNNLSIVDPNNPWANSLGWHGHQNPPVPLNDKTYFHRSNAVICMGAELESQSTP